MPSVRDPYDAHMSRSRTGLYESHYLKGNSPCGNRAFWLKHTLLQPVRGPAVVEFWAVWFERGQAPVVAKTEAVWDQVRLEAVGVGLSWSGGIDLANERASGALADLAWTLHMRGGLAPLHHFRHPWMYRAAFPKKKLCTPRPNVRFDGRFQVADQTFELDDWRGVRGHNWGTEHAWRYAYGNCNRWADGADRTVDGFSARVRVAGRPTPWLSSVVGYAPQLRKNRLTGLRMACTVTESAWALGWRGGRLEMDGSEWVGLRYRHPDGKASYCYNTKFADVRLRVGQQTHTSRCGELEILLPEPRAEVPLHPHPDWVPADGIYRSE